MTINLHMIFQYHSKKISKCITVCPSLVTMKTKVVYYNLDKSRVHLPTANLEWDPPHLCNNNLCTHHLCNNQCRSNLRICTAVTAAQLLLYNNSHNNSLSKDLERGQLIFVPVLTIVASVSVLTLVYLYNHQQETIGPFI